MIVVSSSPKWWTEKLGRLRIVNNGPRHSFWASLQNTSPVKVVEYSKAQDLFYFNSFSQWGAREDKLTCLPVDSNFHYFFKQYHNLKSQIFLLKIHHG